jgi:hypothetical protein
LRHTFVPRIRYLGFTTRGKKGPLTTTGDLSACKSKRTLIQLLTVNTPRITYHPRPTPGPSVRKRQSASSQAVRQTSSNQKCQTKRIKMNRRKSSRRTRRTLDLLAPRGPSACPGGLSTRHGNSSPNSKTRGQPLLSIHGSPKRLKLLRQDLGEM